MASAVECWLTRRQAPAFTYRKNDSPPLKFPQNKTDSLVTEAVSSVHCLCVCLCVYGEINSWRLSILDTEACHCLQLLSSKRHSEAPGRLCPVADRLVPSARNSAEKAACCFAWKAARSATRLSGSLSSKLNSSLPGYILHPIFDRILKINIYPDSGVIVNSRSKIIQQHHTMCLK